MKRLLLCFMTAIGCLNGHAQLLSWTPAFPKENDVITITVDATRGNQGLSGFTGNVYVHVGAITNLSTGPSNWLHAPFTWGSTEAAALATPNGPNKWKYTISNSRSFFNLAPGEQLKSIAILFREGNCSSSCKAQRNADGSDMYIPVYTSNLAVRIDLPASQPKYVRLAEEQNWAIGTSFSINANVNNPSSLKLYHNGTMIASTSNALTLSANSIVTIAGNQQLVAEASDGTTASFDTLNIFVAGNGSPTAALPAGVKDGINYESGDTSVTLVLRAPGKNTVAVIGEFNNWTPEAKDIMNKTPDGKFFWLRIHPLQPGKEYAYQYLVDGNLKIADPYSEKLLDPFNDPSISASTYPNLKPYPAGQTGNLSVLQTRQPAYSWSVNSFNHFDKRGLVIYELLARDFVSSHDWKTLKDTINYLKRLGVNAVEIMPLMEFGGNSSWGYNTYQYFAPDKYYGPKNALKEFIDSCHGNGIAVIMDMVLNHTYGPSPLAQLYWDTQNSRPAPDNPWYNTVQPHAFGFGEDFNHESADTKYFFNRVLEHWIAEYKIDGYRLDFSKGLTQKPSANDAAFSAYDLSRINIIKGYANTVKAVNPDTYIILEHFCDNTEEKELSDNGLMLWANVWTQYQEASMGYLSNSNFERGIHSARGWANPHLVGFMESHDEERIAYKNIKYGNASGNYNIKDTATALKRMELNAAFLFTIPGPKMIWQFGEVGYDYSRCYQSTNGEGGDCDKKTDPKPVRWDYMNDARRKKVYNTYNNLIRLRYHPWYKEAFLSGSISQSLNGGVKWIRLSSGDSSQLFVVGNFDVSAQTATLNFPVAGSWYDYFDSTIFTATAAAQNLTLQPGEFHVFLNRNIHNVTTTPVIDVPWNEVGLAVKAYPNPASSSFMVELDLPQSGNTQIDVYNSVGQYIKTAHNKFLVKGTHQLSMNQLKLSPGRYYLKISTKEASKTIIVTIQ